MDSLKKCFKIFYKSKVHKSSPFHKLYLLVLKLYLSQSYIFEIDWIFLPPTFRNLLTVKVYLFWFLKLLFPIILYAIDRDKKIIDENTKLRHLVKSTLVYFYHDEYVWFTKLIMQYQWADLSIFSHPLPQFSSIIQANHIIRNVMNHDLLVK